MGEGTTLRRTPTDTSNPNVFSDDYALDPFEAISDLSPIGSLDSRPEDLTLGGGDNTQSVPQEYVPPGLPGKTTPLNGPAAGKRAVHTDVAADPHRTSSLASRSMTDIQRTLSTSSRFSMPRAPSPYHGPTAPSQPYGLYPQVIRASSIASESTIRLTERPFIAQGGPEHPYGMFPQNTVPEDDDDAEVPLGLGFPGLIQAFHPGTSSPGNDMGDIVGTDGHIEQLPPYSRYADNVVAKGDMARIDTHTTNSLPTESPLEPPVQPSASSASDVELTAARSEPPTVETEVARKEGLSENRRRRRTCCGMPLWTVITIVAVIVLAAVLGGVIGGVVGTRKGAHQASSSSATTTVWLDADPAETGPSTPPCPTGHYSIPLNQTQEISSCVIDGAFSEVWSCMDFARLGINIFESSDGGPPLSVVFDDYSVMPQLFRYGPQPPDFNGTSFDLSPFKDKDDDELGVALFFSVLFDKLSILPSDALPPPAPSKRSIAASQLARRDAGETGGFLNVGDQPWYCFWNSTINEFWVFLGQDMDGNATSSNSTSSITSVASTSTAAPSHGTSAASPTRLTEATSSQGPFPTTPYPSEPTGGASWTGTKPARLRRAATTNAGAYEFPKLVKMVEKRKPDNNVQPYCQQMQVLNNWQIVPIPTVPTIAIEESDYGPASATAGSKMAMRRQAGDTIQQLGSNCICEWFSD
ncbi:hypothetical protein A1O1_04745 [Capronia coronata CBS 617.96]|uniref:DUF7820 domain-containing protein n=1 Tax=Capronia coronata CBS 617.96 TaxID=1182541 RepID=W9Y5L4_9EURO|nr:uncharacterized protein A1O1_04745 [Capronia coronata CBS 617.96]EXJ87818.1 hypothetical protein A1O1_04745 [Capronia coronata CBS 617.96]